MNEMEQQTAIQLLVSEPGADPERLDDLTRLLLSRLREEGLDARPGRQEAPANTKSAEALTLGAVLVAVAPHFLPQLIQSIQQWVTTGERRRAVRIKTPEGTEVEFTPDRDLSPADVIKIVKGLTNTGR